MQIRCQRNPHWAAPQRRSGRRACPRALHL